MIHQRLISTLFILTFTLSACSNENKQKQVRIVDLVEVGSIGTRQTVTPGKVASTEVKASITLRKKEIFGKEFFYGADLQYSSVYDKDYDLYNQSLALGHVPANFRKSGNELQLIADQRRLYPSDVNHPEQLISRFRILSETADTITVSEGNASLFIVSLLDSKVNQAKDHWARSFEFVEKGNYLLQESSVVLPNGDILEVMESVFPRETLAPSAKFEKFKLDPEDAVGATDGAAARYRMLMSETIFNGEEKLSYAQHYDIYDAVTGAPTTIDWYVTPNIKDEQLPVVRDAVEGWNRYFRKFKGIERDVVLFKGRTPDWMKIGDPRFNIINWDSRLIAGAAYESQATDPFTGKQSHSVIYMPVAWFQIGMDYWKYGQYNDSHQAKDSSVKTFNHDKLVKASCIRELSGVVAAIQSSRMKKEDVEKFSIQLMKQTLFHEVGHAMGLAHNFKGSLSFDRQDPNSVFSTSIMDYNDYEIERAAFFDAPMVSGDGPLLEYDRQALSALYNGLSDVGLLDPVLPACNDAEADTEDSGEVDPLCIRYDIEKDPTISVETALNRVNLDQIPGDVTLADALEQVTVDVLSQDALSKVTNADEAKALYQKYLFALKGTMGFYFLSGKASLSKVVRTNVKSLYVFEEGILPDSYSEQDMRERAFKGVHAVTSMMGLSAAVKGKILTLSNRAPSLLLQSPYGSALSIDVALQLQQALAERTLHVVSEFENDPVRGLPRLRAGVLGSIERSEGLPFFYGSIGSVSYDFEASLMTILFESVVTVTASSQERLLAAKSMATYRGRPSANALLSRAIGRVNQELKMAKTNDSRELAIALKTALINQNQ